MKYEYDAAVIKVIDGDTVDLLVDLGFHTKLAIRTRLLGVDAPEVSTEEGRHVRDELRTYLPIGMPVMVKTFKDPTDKYGRWLASITRAGDVDTIAAWLLANGYARSYPQ